MIIRFFIFLLTLNALSPITGFACVSTNVSTMPKAMISDVQDVQRITHEQSVSPVSMTSTASQVHCNNSSMMDTRIDKACDSACCVNCIAVSTLLITSPADIALLAAASSLKPISGTTTFYTRYLSPELQPPLI